MRKAIILLGAALLFFMGVSGSSQVSAAAEKGSPAGSQENQSLVMENGKQVITILARGGYSPSETVAKAGLPTILRVVTKKTFDCSRALLLPSLRVQKILPATGAIDFTIPAQNAGTEFYGICSMGMYAFVITFK